MKPITVPDLLRNAAQQFGEMLALRQPDRGEVHTWNWNQYLAAAEEIAAGLRALGVHKGEHVAICAETRAEFYLADMGIMMNGSVAAALYPSYPPIELIKTIGAADAKILFVEDAHMFGMLKGAPVEHIILLTGEAVGAMTLAQLRRHGRYAEPLTGDDNAILYLTSGATGDPKMVMVTHGSVISNINMGPRVLPMTPDDITIAFLPSAHIAQRIALEMLPILYGTPVSFAESLSKLPGEFKSVRPTIFLAPPRMWERVYTSIRTEVQKRPPVAQKAFAAALGLGLGAAKYKRQGKKVPFYIRIPLELAGKVVFAKIRERFGGRLRVALSGAAPLGADLADFYDAIGMPLSEGYGLTEGGVLALNPEDGQRSGSIGKALPGVKFQVAAEDGELLVQSPSLSKGYYKDPVATAALFEGGWLHTGDVGTIDKDGYIYITGRKKELIVSSNGKKIFPSRVEALFKFYPLISQVVLAGDRLPHLVALITVNPQVAEALDGVKGGKNAGENPATTAEVQKEVQRIVSKVNKDLAPFEQVKRFKVLPRDFTIEDGELTATMKVRRKKVLDNFDAEVQELYRVSAAGRGGE